RVARAVKSHRLGHLAAAADVHLEPPAAEVRADHRHAHVHVGTAAEDEGAVVGVEGRREVEALAAPEEHAAATGEVVLDRVEHRLLPRLVERRDKGVDENDEERRAELAALNDAHRVRERGLFAAHLNLDLDVGVQRHDQAAELGRHAHLLEDPVECNAVDRVGRIDEVHKNDVRVEVAPFARRERELQRHVAVEAASFWDKTALVAEIVADEHDVLREDLRDEAADELRDGLHEPDAARVVHVAQVALLFQDGQLERRPSHRRHAGEPEIGEEGLELLEARVRLHDELERVRWKAVAARLARLELLLGVFDLLVAGKLVHRVNDRARRQLVEHARVERRLPVVELRVGRLKNGEVFGGGRGERAVSLAQPKRPRRVRLLGALHKRLGSRPKRRLTTAVVAVAFEHVAPLLDPVVLCVVDGPNDRLPSQEQLNPNHLLLSARPERGEERLQLVPRRRHRHNVLVV
ncbi:hypothetical protein M885DRAFT_596895, partial [Pelagophyceae sp. CCMP2097]